MYWEILDLNWGGFDIRGRYNRGKDYVCANVDVCGYGYGSSREHQTWFLWDLLQRGNVVCRAPVAKYVVFSGSWYSRVFVFVWLVLLVLIKIHEYACIHTCIHA